MTKIELQLISDSSMYLFLMDTIRGGICVVNKKFVKADNIYTRKVHDESSDRKVMKKIKQMIRINLYCILMQIIYMDIQ